VSVAAYAKIDRPCTFVVGNRRIGLHFEELRNDVAVAYSGGEVERCVASLVAGVDHLLHKPHQSYGLWVVAVLEERGDLGGADVAADEVLEQRFEVVFAGCCAPFYGACHCNVVEDGPALGVAKLDQRCQDLQCLWEAAVVETVVH